MPQPAIMNIPQPCPESWAAMHPAAAGRHCAACQKTVVDFTLKTDDEVLVYLARSAGFPTCGRFAAGQLERPLRPVALAAPARWRAWLAAAVAVWSLRAAGGTAAKAQAPAERHTMGKALAAPSPVAVSHPTSPSAASTMVVRGVVLDSISHEGLPGVTVLLKGTTVGISTNSDGTFELPVPAESATPTGILLTVIYVGYVSQQRIVATTAPLTFLLRADETSLMGEVVICRASGAPPWPWHPRRFYSWSKYWLTRPFRRN